jgi:hypothetical protein
VAAHLEMFADAFAVESVWVRPGQFGGCRWCPGSHRQGRNPAFESGFGLAGSSGNGVHRFDKLGVTGSSPVPPTRKAR